MIKRIIAIAVVLAVAVCAVGCKSAEQIEKENAAQTAVPNVTVNMPEEGVDVITVSGQGMVKKAPDTANVDFSVRSEGKEPESVQEENSAAMEAVKAALIELGIAGEDIVTGYVQLYEMYNYDKSPAEMTGYEMYNNITVTVRDIEQVGAVMSAAIAAGATSLGGVTFTLSDNSEEYNSALKAAMQDAYSKALAIAEAAGCTVDPIPLAVTETGYDSIPVLYSEEPMADEAASMSDSGGDVSVSTGELDVNASVTVQYTILRPGA